MRWFRTLWRVHGVGNVALRVVLFWQTVYGHDLEAKRAADDFYDFVPYHFTKKQVRRVEEYEPERCVTTLKMVRCWRPSARLCCLQL